MREMKREKRKWKRTKEKIKRTGLVWTLESRLQLLHSIEKEQKFHSYERAEISQNVFTFPPSA